MAEKLSTLFIYWLQNIYAFDYFGAIITSTKKLIDNIDC